MSYTISKQRKSSENHDPRVVSSNQYNNASGAQKTINGGPFLKAIPVSTHPITGIISYTMDCSVGPVFINKGITVALYNSDVVAHAVVIGDATIIIPTVGAVDVSGRPGIAIPPDKWTYINTYDQQYIFTDSNFVFCYLLEDGTYLQ